MQPLMNHGWHWVLETGKLQPTDPLHANPSLWRFGPQLEFSCTLWKEIMFELVFDKAAVPSHCHGCYKVISKPRTLAELIKIETVQQNMKGFGRSKCGIEARDYTPRLYGAYWYCDGLEAGYEMLAKVRAVFPNIPTILKRGCTEYEMHCGPSDKWEITDDQLELEALTLAHVDLDPYNIPGEIQPEPFVNDTHWLWIKWAFSHGDTTYLQFTNGVPLHPDYVSYEPPAAVSKGEEQQPLDFDGKDKAEQ